MGKKEEAMKNRKEERDKERRHFFVLCRNGT
jgi:hypothetical protein